MTIEPVMILSSLMGDRAVKWTYKRMIEMTVLVWKRDD